MCATWNANSVSLSDVTGAIGLAADGDIVAIPAGIAEWDRTVTISKAITLQGAGAGQTIIKDGVLTGYLISWNLVANKASRMTQTTVWSGSNTTNTTNRIAVNGVNTDSRTMRVDNCIFSGLLAPCFIFNTVKGVVDNNTIVGHETGIAAFVGHVKGSSWNGTQGENAYGDGAWAEDENFGSDNFIFFETNTIKNLYTGSPLTSLDCQAGGRYVFRYNTIQGGSLETHGAEAARERAGRAFEIYNNTFTGNDVRSNPIYMRGGVGIVYNNTIGGWATANFALLDNRSIDHQFAPIQGADGRNPWDKNHPSNPLDTGRIFSTGTLFMGDNTKSWTDNQWASYVLRKTSGTRINILTRDGANFTAVATGHPFAPDNVISIFGAEQYAFNGLFTILNTGTNTFTFQSNYTPSSPATGTIYATRGNHFALIISNTSTGIVIADPLHSSHRMTLASGDLYEINKVTQSMDQAGIGSGSNLGGVDTPAIPAGWNNQVASPWYQWNNLREGGAAVNFSTAFGGGGNYAVIVSGTHYYDGIVRPGYSAYTYPHPLRGVIPRAKRLGRRLKFRGFSY